MESTVKPRWGIGEAENAGIEAHKLATKYMQELTSRLKKDELTQFKIQVDELTKRRSGQKENLVTQKAKTNGQDEVLKEIHSDVVSIRNLVKSNNPTDEIYKAYGVGEKINNTIVSTKAAANLVLLAYAAYPVWSKDEAGIFEEDIKEITDGLTKLDEAADDQDNSIFIRKTSTMDKNTLQRLVENEVIRLSAMGSHVFRKKNPAVSDLFDKLIVVASDAKPAKDKVVS